MTLLLALSALLVGGLLAVQASVNQRLSATVGTPFGASTVQLAVAALSLAAVAAATGAIGAVSAVPHVQPGWLLLGGLASPLYITAGILLLPRLGALSAVGLFVAGQVLMSLVLDTAGWLAVPVQQLSAGRVLGAATVVAGIATVVRSQRAGLYRRAPVPVGARETTAPATELDAPRHRAGWVTLGLLAGAGLPVQGAVNARLREQVGAPLAVGAISFTVATLAIAAVLLALLALRRTPAPRLRALPSMPWWGWLGGICAATYVTGTFLLLPVIGAAVTVALTVSGQQLASAAVDRFGWFGMPRRPLTPSRVLGLALLLAGSALVQLA